MTAMLWWAQDLPSNSMKLMSLLILCLLATSAYIWLTSKPTIKIVEPSEQQRQEMLGIVNTPSVPLTPL